MTYNPKPFREKDAELAKAWYEEHRPHVDRMLEAYTGTAFPPSGSDCIHPELWKAGHWKWFLVERYAAQTTSARKEIEPLLWLLRVVFAFMGGLLIFVGVQIALCIVAVAADGNLNRVVYGLIMVECIVGGAFVKVSEQAAKVWKKRGGS